MKEVLKFAELKPPKAHQAKVEELWILASYGSGGIDAFSRLDKLVNFKLLWFKVAMMFYKFHTTNCLTKVYSKV